MSKRQVTRYLIFRTLGNFLILFVIFAFFATFGPALYYEVKYRIGNARGVTYALPDTEPSQFAALIKAQEQQKQNPGSDFTDILSSNKEKVLVPPDSNFSVVIPKIGAAEKVVPNVDPDNENEYLDVLRTSIAHAKGSAFPGLGGTIYLFAHSADNFWDVGRYNAVFYLLKDMQVGDNISLFFQNKRYNYTVYDKKIVDPSDTEYITANIGQGERLILQTCWPPGTAWKRLLIFAKPKNA